MIKVRDTTGKILFEERQRFPQWLFLLMIMPLLVTIASFAATGILSDERTGIWIVFPLVILLQVVVMYYFRITRFEKIVSETGLYFRWMPLQKKYRFIPREDIEGFRMRRGPVLKLGSGYYIGLGRYHTVSTGIGVHVFLNHGKKIFFGTDEQIFFQRAMEKIAKTIELT
ncbi:MAG: hypothetical protein ACJ75F_02170 [Flavisolibacter sp.]|jgi:hypothetical protein